MRTPRSRRSIPAPRRQIGKTEVVEQTLFQNQEKWEARGDVDGTVAAVLSPAEMNEGARIGRRRRRSIR